MASSVSAQYAAGVAAGTVERDDAQVGVVAMMTRLEERIVQARLARKSSALGWLFMPSGKR
jgi:cell division protein ZapE